MSDWINLTGEGRNPRRIRKLQIEVSLFAEIIGQGIPSGIEPNERVEDLHIVGLRLDMDSGHVEALVQSEQFEEVREGEDVPIWTPSFTRTYPVGISRRAPIG